MIEKRVLKNITIRYSGRSSDFIFPSISVGCEGECVYCYAARHSPDFRKKIYISKNLRELIHLVQGYDTSKVIKPNQTHEKYITWDISCNSDMSIDINYFDWKLLFDYFKNSERDLGTFATKFTNSKLLKYNPDKKIRVRMSLMPDSYSEIFEPKTAKIINRIKFINKLYDAGYEVHVNFSPVILTNTWEDDYKRLFELLNDNISDDVKTQIRSEVIFLTHNEKMHVKNLKNKIKGESILWVPRIQELKQSQFGGNNVRYKKDLKKVKIQKFRDIINEVIPYCFIRYIF